MLFGRGESPYQASTASLPLVQVRGFEKCQTIVTYTNGEKMAELKITPLVALWPQVPLCSKRVWTTVQNCDKPFELFPTFLVEEFRPLQTCNS